MNIQPSYFLAAGIPPWYDFGCSFSSFQCYSCWTYLALSGATMTFIALLANQWHRVGEPLFHRWINTKNSSIRIEDVDAILDAAENTGQEALVFP